LRLVGSSQSGASPADPSTSIAPALSTVALTTSMDVLNDSVKLGIGDRVSLRIVEERRVPISLFVTDSGEMEVPLIGRVVAKGKTCKQLAYELKPILEKEYFYKATVIIGVDNISVRSRGRVYITGQVRNEGGLEIPPDEPLTVSKAVLRIGGLSDFANRRKVKLVRKKADGTSETRIIDLYEILDKGRLEKDVVLEPGDLISVPERFF
jgi:polysaccharide biosynthesis/export protein